MLKMKSTFLHFRFSKKQVWQIENTKVLLTVQRSYTRKEVSGVYTGVQWPHFLEMSQQLGCISLAMSGCRGFSPQKVKSKYRQGISPVFISWGRDCFFFFCSLNSICLALAKFPVFPKEVFFFLVLFLLYTALTFCNFSFLVILINSYSLTSL